MFLLHPLVVVAPGRLRYSSYILLILQIFCVVLHEPKKTKPLLYLWFLLTDFNNFSSFQSGMIST